MDQKEKEWVKAQYDMRSDKASNKDAQQQKEKDASATFQRISNLATGHFYRMMAAELGPKPLTIVDLGCGQGADVHKMTNLTHLSKYYGFDVSAKSIDGYTRRVQQHGRADVEYYLQTVDLTLDPLPALVDDSVDMVICRNALHYFVRPALWAWVHRILAPGGFFGILCINGQTLETQVFEPSAKGQPSQLPTWISFERETSVREFLPVVEEEMGDIWNFDMITRFFTYLDLPIEPSYRFSLQGLVSNVRETLLMPPELCKSANGVGLNLDVFRNSWDMYQDSQKKVTLDGLRGPSPSQLSGGDVFTSQLYQFYRFRKFVS